MNQNEPCLLCPHKCRAIRSKQAGTCGGTNQIRIARAMQHPWEEPCISGTNGSGAVFFSGCALQCCYCQNHEISANRFGTEISVEKLSDLFLKLQDQGAHNINLVTAGHYTPWVISALERSKPRLKIPVIYNSSGYELPDTLSMLNGLVDIYLPDIKYYTDSRARRYSQAPDYFEIAANAVMEMYRQVGNTVFKNSGLLKKGMIIRHLLLPKGSQDAISILDWIAAQLPLDHILISIMSQYTPCYLSKNFPEINRTISTYEYQKVITHAQKLGIAGYMQERDSAKTIYTPSFCLQGID